MAKGSGINGMLDCIERMPEFERRVCQDKLVSLHKRKEGALRREVATAALQGLLASMSDSRSPEIVAEYSVSYADALLAELEK
jgi:hypothetical protein